MEYLMKMAWVLGSISARERVRDQERIQKGFPSKGGVSVPAWTWNGSFLQKEPLKYSTIDELSKKCSEVLWRLHGKLFIH